MPFLTSSVCRALGELRHDPVGDVADQHRDARSPCSARRPSRRPRRSARRPPARGRRRASRPCGSSRRRAPARACHGARRSRRCSCAIGVEPTKLSALTSGCASSASTATLSPWTTLNTPSGRPACLQQLGHEAATATGRARSASARRCCRRRSRPGTSTSAPCTGKLNGVMPATTPSGWRKVQLSMPVETWSVKSPFSSCGMPQANSTMSMPRVTSPCASVKTLPCSAVIIAASVSRCSFSRSRNLSDARAAERRRVGPGRNAAFGARPRRRPRRPTRARPGARPCRSPGCRPAGAGRSAGDGAAVDVVADLGRGGEAFGGAHGVRSGSVMGNGGGASIRQSHAAARPRGAAQGLAARAACAISRPRAERPGLASASR